MPLYVDTDEQTKAATEAAFERYLSTLAVGRADAIVGHVGPPPEELAGAISACIRRGIVAEEDIVDAVSRFADCSRRDALGMLLRLTEWPSGFFRRDEDGDYYLRPPTDRYFV